MTRLTIVLFATALAMAPAAASAAGADSSAAPNPATAATTPDRPADAATADAGFAARRAVAAQYLRLYLEHADLAGVAVRAVQPMLQQIAGTQPELWKAQKAELTGIAVSSFVKVLHDVLAGLDVGMAKTFTLQELTALRDFYASPEGRSVMTKMPGFMQKAVPVAMDEAMRRMTGIRAALEAEGVKP